MPLTQIISIAQSPQMAYPHTKETINRWFSEWHRMHPLFCRYSRCPTPFNGNNYFTIIAKSPKPLTKSKAILLEDNGERYPTEWAEAERQVRLQGGRNHELGAGVLPRIETFIQLWTYWIKVQKLSGAIWQGNWFDVDVSGSARSNASLAKLWGPAGQDD